MRKTPQIITVILIAALFTSTFLTYTTASEPLWGIDIGDTINYDLNYVEIDYSFPPVNYNATGITFDNESSIIEEGSIVAFNATDINNTIIEYDLIYNGTHEKNYRSATNFSDDISFLLNLPLKFALNETDIAGIKRVFTGLDYLVVPAVNDTWDEFDDYDNPLFLAITEELFASQAEIDLEGKTTIDFATDECIFDWFVNGTYLSVSNATEFDFDYNLKMAYEISSGLLNGMRMLLDIEGENNGVPTTLYISSEVEKEGYDLAEFLLPSGDPDVDLNQLLSNLLPGFNWFLFPLAFIPILLLELRRNKKK